MTTQHVVVVGAGVVGLTTALELARDGHRVRVVAAEPPAATTSAVAAALWYPYLVGPADAVARWGAVAAERFAALADDPDVPVEARTVNDLLREADVPPAWRTDMPDLRRAAVPGHLAPDVRDRWCFTSWVADMPPYLRWLGARLEAAGVDLEVRRLAALADAWADDVDVVVDCTGVDAGPLADDAAVEPVRGQVVLVRCPEVDEVWLDADGPGGATYVIPRTDTVVLGGTAERGAWERVTSEAVTRDVLARARRLVPVLADAEVVDVGVGLRPSRPQVRLGWQDTPAGPVLHSYGHGGAGVTLSWGVAAEAATMVRAGAVSGAAGSRPAPSPGPPSGR